MAPKAKDGTSATATSPTSEVDVPGYEQARDELLTTVRRLEEGGLPLEESLALWERGEQLAAICQSWLDGARQRLAGHRPPARPGPSPADDPDSETDAD
jgi:exodeoxyribonuclease VII small subunit